MNQTELKHFVTEWMLSQDKDMEFAPDENGYVMFRRGACSINIAAYFQMILEDFLEAQAIESYKDGWVSVNVKFDAGSVILENERGDRYKSESESLIDFFMLSEQPLPTPPQTKPI